MVKKELRETIRALIIHVKGDASEEEPKKNEKGGIPQEELATIKEPGRPVGNK